MPRYKPFRRPNRPRPPDTPNGPVKQIFGLYQCHHHLAFLTGEDGTVRQPGQSGKATKPRRAPFSYKVDELDRLIRPALPYIDSGFRNKCHESNLQWQKSQIENLIDHYRYVESRLQGDIRSSKLSKCDLISFLTTARNWASNHFRRKFQPDVFKKVDTIVRGHAFVNEPPTPSTSSTTVPKPKPPTPPTSTTILASTTKPTPPTVSTTSIPSTSKSAPTANKPPPNPTSSATNPSRANNQQCSTDKNPPTTKKLPSTVNETKEAPTTSTDKPTPTPQPMPSVSTPSKKRGRRESLETSPTSSQAQKKSKSSQPLVEPQGGSDNRPKPTERCGVTRFPRLPPKTYGEKILDHWYIPKITKNTVVFGTSNLARISQIGRMDAQIISYPGLKLDSMSRILTKFEFGPESPRIPEHVVFAIGINDRGLSKSTINIGLKKLVNLARKKFEGCKISLYMNRFSPSLAPIERQNLEDLNKEIEKQCEMHKLNLIASVPKKFFKVDSHDHIHWTTDCANATISHIIDTAIKRDVHNVNNSSRRTSLN